MQHGRNVLARWPSSFETRRHGLQLLLGSDHRRSELAEYLVVPSKTIQLGRDYGLRTASSADHVNMRMASQQTNCYGGGVAFSLQLNVSVGLTEQ